MRLLTGLTAILLTAGSLLADDNQRIWEGKWNNKKYGTSGPLRCVAEEVQPGQWQATFTGKFQGDPFEYKANFQSKKARRGLELSGKAKLRGHRYEWTGSMDQTKIKGSYKSSVGYFGEFILTEKKPGS